MPAEVCRMYPARSNNWWLTTSASAGFSRKVGIKSLLQCMGVFSLASSRNIRSSSVVECFLGRGWIFSSRRFTRTALVVTPAFLRKTSSDFFALIFPDDCRICAAPLKEVTRIPVCRACLSKPAPLSAEYFCAECRTPFLNPYPLDENGLCGLCRHGLNNYDSAYSFGAYEGELRALIHLFKYGKIQTLAQPLGKLMASALPRDQRFDFILPMPLHWRRRWSRGFNQSELLAREIASRTGVPVRQVLRRVRNTPAQAGLTNAKRRDNVVRAFRVTALRPLEGRRVLLIDDVMTTGASASACAIALKKAGYNT
jgi:competence protein ComFC